MSSPQLRSIRNLLRTRREQIGQEVVAKKSIGKRQCIQWLDELCDVVFCYDPDTTTDARHQPYVDLIDVDDDPSSEPKTTTTCLSTLSLDDNIENKPKSEQNVTTIVEPKEELLIGSSDNKRSREEPRYKGVIRGFDDIVKGSAEDDWSDPDFESKKKKITETTRQTRQSARNGSKSESTKPTDKTNEKKSNNKKKTEKKSENCDLWATDGKVLGGDTGVEATAKTPEEMRLLMAQKTEQRLQALGSKGCKGVVKLPASAPADRSDSPLDSSKLLRWQL